MDNSFDFVDPGLILARGKYRGFPWLIAKNPMGFRCGYIIVPDDHPWAGKHISLLRSVNVHGGVTLSAGAAVPGNPWVIGFDCGHEGDLPDPALMPETTLEEECAASGDDANMIKFADIMMSQHRDIPKGIRSQEYVELEVIGLCDQAYEAANKQKSIL